MGYGDYLMMSGEFKALRRQFPHVAISVDYNLEKHPFFVSIFQNNPYYKQHKALVKDSRSNVIFLQPPGRSIWSMHHRDGKPYQIWNMDFTSRPGEIFLTEDERARAQEALIGIDNKVKVFLQPFGRNKTLVKDVPRDYAPNKLWPYYGDLIDGFGGDIAFINAIPEDNEFNFPKVKGAHNIVCSSFRDACALLEACDLYLGNEGGMHHAAAALDKRGVVIFGNWISPKTTGYAIHDNVYVGDLNKPCGLMDECEECKRIMREIPTETIAEKVINVIDSLVK